MKSLSINDFEAEVIPSAELVRMMSKIAEQKQATEPTPAKEGWKMRAVGKALLVIGSLYFAIHILVWAVK